MPELPEVETIVRALRPQLVGATVLEAEVRWGRTVAEPGVKAFKERVRGQTVLEVGRRAKFVNIRLSAYNLLIHLRMSGDLSVKMGKIEAGKHDRLILKLRLPGVEGRLGNLVFNDTRKFGRVWLTDEAGEVTGDLGPEPLEEGFTAEWLYRALRGRHRQLKPLLLDQTFLAGLGNIYTDEALHLARLHPLRLSDTVTRAGAGRLRDAIRSVLEEGIRRNGASIDWVYRGGEYQNHFRVYGREGKACPVCGRRIRRIVVGQRGTHYCPNCQKE